MTHTLTASGVSILLALSALTVPMSIQAQSAYTLNTLKPNFLQQALPADAPLHIDAKNRVYGTGSFYLGISFDTGGLLVPFIPVYKDYIVQWAVPSLGTTVSATKLSNTRQQLRAMSPNANTFITSETNYSEERIWDRATNKPVQPGVLRDELGFERILNDFEAINLVGQVTGNLSTWLADESRDRYISYIWTPGQATATRLARAPAFDHTRAWAINASGTVVGSVYAQAKASEVTQQRAARWVNGTLEILDEQPNKTTIAIDINDAGHILLWNFEQIPGSSGYYSVMQNGVTTAIVPTAGYIVWEAKAINASGTVIGTLAPLPAANATPVSYTGSYNSPARIDSSRRAFIWKNGVMTDLTTWVTSKGVKLPAGIALNKAIDLNDQGSIVAGYQNGKSFVFVRLLAKP